MEIWFTRLDWPNSGLDGYEFQKQLSAVVFGCEMFHVACGNLCPQLEASYHDVHVMSTTKLTPTYLYARRFCLSGVNCIRIFSRRASTLDKYAAEDHTENELVQYLRLVPAYSTLLYPTLHSTSTAIGTLKLAHETMPKAPRLLDSDWAVHRQVIEDLYLQQGKSLREVKDIMHCTYGFSATQVLSFPKHMLLG